MNTNLNKVETKYHNYYYGHVQVMGPNNLTIIANESNIRVLVNGVQIADYRDVIVNRYGSMHLTVHSGTNKDWGILCEYENINYYTW